MNTVSSHSESDALKAAILELLKARKPLASICPSEAVRMVFREDWREQMPQVRKVANEMAEQGQIEICQRGTVVDPTTAKGPIRLRIPKSSS